MSSRPVSQRAACRACTAIMNDALVKRSYSVGTGAYSIQKADADAIGSANVTFDGVAAGCEIRVFTQDGTELAGIESCGANQALSWPAYSVGNPNNSVRIVIVGTAYEIMTIPYVSQLGTWKIPVQQRRDKWYSNPA